MKALIIKNLKSHDQLKLDNFAKDVLRMLPNGKSLFLGGNWPYPTEKNRIVYVYLFSRNEYLRSLCQWQLKQFLSYLIPFKLYEARNEVKVCSMPVVAGLVTSPI